MYKYEILNMNSWCSQGFDSKWNNKWCICKCFYQLLPIFFICFSHNGGASFCPRGTLLAKVNGKYWLSSTLSLKVATYSSFSTDFFKPSHECEFFSLKTYWFASKVNLFDRLKIIFSFWFSVSSVIWNRS